MAADEELERVNADLDYRLVSYFDLFVEYQTLHAELANHLKNVPPRHTIFYRC